MPTGTVPTAPGSGVGPRLTLARKAAGYLGAGTLSLYLLLKIYWVFAAFFGVGVNPDSSAANWIGINAVTVGMAVIGVAVALALAQDWGRRVPARLVGFTSWTAAGFLVSIIPVHATRLFLPAQGDPVDVELGIHRWELTLVAVGFIGMGVGLSVAGPIYLRERWPAAFVGAAGDARPPRSRTAVIGIALAALFAVATLYWLLGGELFVNDSMYDTEDPNTAALFFNEALWALAAAVSAWVLVRARSGVPVWIPMALLWIGSGSLFAWNCWRLFISLVFAPTQTMNTLEQPFAAIAVETAAALAGALLFATALAVYSARRGQARELRSRAWSPPDSPRPPTSTHGHGDSRAGGASPTRCSRPQRCASRGRMIRVGTVVLATISALIAAQPASAQDNSYERGPDPTAQSVGAERGTFATSKVNVPSGHGFNGGVIYYPTDADQDYVGIAAVPGCTASRSGARGRQLPAAFDHLSPPRASGDEPVSGSLPVNCQAKAS